MSAILYNINSSLIPKFQRHDLLKQSKDSSGTASRSKTPSSLSLEDRMTQPGEENNDADIPFDCDVEKDTDVYLKQLCCSVYPSPLHARIEKLKSKLDLATHALLALMVKNFICCWYGTKIPTSDEEFLSYIFDKIQDFIDNVKTWEIDYETLIGDDLPRLLSDHSNAMKLVDNEADVFKQYCCSTKYEEGYYPFAITNVVNEALKNESYLQSTFFDSLLNCVILGKIIDRINEPFYLLSALSSASSCILLRRLKPQDKQRKWSFGVFSSSFNALKNLFYNLGLLVQTSQDIERRPSLPLPYRYIFTFLFKDIVRLPNRKPFLYAVGKTVQFWIGRSDTLNAIMRRLFEKARDHLLNEKYVTRILISCRRTLFPHDNKMGPGTVLPTGEEFERVKRECIENLWNLLKVYKMDRLTGMEEKDIMQGIELMCKDQRCNKILIFRVIDCILAHATSPSINISNHVTIPAAKSP